eukprot:m.30249 g.30249  ORF g.30249 m.30249 type:complete len:833 (+) comp9266_c0_seq2:287-2785(+)
MFGSPVRQSFDRGARHGPLSAQGSQVSLGLPAVPQEVEPLPGSAVQAQPLTSSSRPGTASSNHVERLKRFDDLLARAVKQAETYERATQAPKASGASRKRAAAVDPFKVVPFRESMLDTDDEEDDDANGLRGKERGMAKSPAPVEVAAPDSKMPPRRPSVGWGINEGMGGDRQGTAAATDGAPGESADTADQDGEDDDPFAQAHEIRVRSNSPKPALTRKIVVSSSDLLANVTLSSQARHAQGRRDSTGSLSSRGVPSVIAWDHASEDGKQVSTTPALPTRIQVVSRIPKELPPIAESNSTPQRATQYVPAPTPFRGSMDQSFRVYDEDSDSEDITVVTKTWRQQQDALVEEAMAQPDDPDEQAHVDYIVTQDSHPMQIAAAHGETRRVMELLSEGAYVDEPDPQGRTALMYAVHCNRLETTQCLLDHGADVNAQSLDGATALHRAAFCGTEAMEKLLLQNGANHAIPDEDGRLPLHWAAHNLNIRCLHVLLKLSPNYVNQPDHAGMTVVLWAAYYDRVHQLAKLLRNEADLSAADVDGKHAIHWSVHPHSTSCLKYLLDVETSKYQDGSGRTAMHLAAESGSIRAIKLIYRTRQSAVNDLDAQGRTPMHYAAVCNMPQSIWALAKRGGQLGAIDSHGKSPLDYAVEHGCIESVTYINSLLNHLATPEEQTHSIETALQKTHLSEEDIDGHVITQEVLDVFYLLTVGTYLQKYTAGGKGPCHMRYFWIDLFSGELCWVKSPQDFASNPEQVSAVTILNVSPHASVSIRARKDYAPEDEHRFSFMITTNQRHLDLIAPSEDIFKLWNYGIRCLLAYGDALLYAAQLQFATVNP